MMRSLHRVALTCFIAAVVTSGAWASERWGQFRGPLAAGLELAGSLPDGEYGLAVAWTRDLGSGYSNVSIADGKAIAMYTDGDVDVVAALSVATGDEVWRYEMGEKYAGHDSSTDGPRSTPAIAGDTVYVFGPHGQLAALGLADGAEKWRRDLDEENSTVPFHGYTSSPVVAGELVIVATGGEGHSITAFDEAGLENLRRTGRRRDQRGDRHRRPARGSRPPARAAPDGGQSELELSFPFLADARRPQL